MSELTKNTLTLHVHFEDDVAVEPTLKSPSSNDENGRKDEAIENNGTLTLNYSRDDLLRLRNSSMANRLPKFATDDSQIDDKRKEKIRMVVKMNGGTVPNFAASQKRTTTFTTTASGTDRKYRKNNVDALESTASATARKSDSNGDEKLPSERERLGFQQLMAAASGPNAVNSSVEPSAEPHANVRRQRVGSGRITENLCIGGGLWNNGYRHSGTGSDKEVAFHLNYGVDYRHANNDFFDKRSTASGNGGRSNKPAEGERSEAYEWNKENNRFPHLSSRESSAEPEWVSCGPTSKHDVIELHGFDGPAPETDDSGKFKEGRGGHANPPPPRSTPTKGEEHFNFEDAFKLDLQGRGGESRFSQWFRHDSSPKKNGTGFDAKGHHGPSGHSFASTEQFIDLVHKTHGKKIDSNLMASSAKFRSVEELEAEWVPPTVPNHAAKHTQRQRYDQAKAANDLMDLQKMLSQMEQKNRLHQQQQHQQQHHHRANIMQQLSFLQQFSNPSFNQFERERETLMALLNMQQQQQQQQYQQSLPFMQHANIGQSFRQFQANIAGGMAPQSPTHQQMQFHTQAIMQNALLKKQLEEQNRKSQPFHWQSQQHHRSSMSQSPQPNFHNNQSYGQPPFRNNKPKFHQVPKDGAQSMTPPQSKPIFGRFAPTSATPRAGHANRATANASAASPAAPTPMAEVAAATAPTTPTVTVDK